ncbi:MAG TPA: hypothetical protein VIV11_23245 [Kofleriaceae bacterium]
MRFLLGVRAMKTTKLLVTAALCVGCATSDELDVEVEDDAEAAEAWEEDTSLIAACNDALPVVDTEAPIFTYFGVYMPSSGLAPRADAPQTLAIAASGERVLTLRRARVPCVPLVQELLPWRQGGGLVAYNMTIAELSSAMGDGSAANLIEEILRSGYAYVAIDELAMVNTTWRNGGVRVSRFRNLLAALATRGLDRRLIFYVNTYNMAGRLHLYSDVLRALRDHARIVASEVYVTSRDVFAPVTQTNGRCQRSTRCFEQLAAELGSVAPNINYRTITVLGVSDEYNQGATNALCEGPTGLAGALFKQYSTLHQGARTRLQPGVGAYTLARIDRENHPSWGATDHVACKNRLDAWTWPRARD